MRALANGRNEKPNGLRWPVGGLPALRVPGQVVSQGAGHAQLGDGVGADHQRPTRSPVPEPRPRPA